MVPCRPRPPRVARPLPSQNLPSATAPAGWPSTPHASAKGHAQTRALRDTPELCLGRTPPPAIWDQLARDAWEEVSPLRAGHSGDLVCPAERLAQRAWARGPQRPREAECQAVPGGEGRGALRIWGLAWLAAGSPPLQARATRDPGDQAWWGEAACVWGTLAGSPRLV